ncbi:MAG: PDZ domain-containing protein [Planctomycetota bacterium]|jgi:poly(3-hydroxybutyrate) depolymerase
MRTALIWLLLCGTAAASDDLDRALAALRTAARADYGARIQAVLDLKPETAEVIRRLEKGPEVTTTLEAGWHRLEAEDEEGARRPFQLYVPAAAAGKTEPLPLLVHLHGGVSRPEYTQKEREVGAGTLWLESADEAPFVVAYPLGRADCTWWSEAGVRHIRAVIRETKRRVAVDDDAIVGTGFSDGGSGCFHLAMVAPDPFAAFLPMNGYPAVSAINSGKQVYLRNMQRTPQFVAMTQDDQLYAAAKVMEHLDPAMKAGASIRIVSYESGGHRPVYFADQQAAFVRFITDTPRDPHPQEIDWWCAEPCRVSWVEILELGPVAGDAEPLPDLNVIRTPGRIRLGFHPDREHPGPGVRVAGVVEETTAARIGLATGDVITQLDEAAIATLADVVAALRRKQHDQPVKVVVRRGETDVTLAGRIPPFETRPWYARKNPTARFSLRAEGNRVEITSRHVRRFRLHLTPALFEAGRVEVVVNGRRVEAALEAVPLPVLLRRYAALADSGRILTRVLQVTLPGLG